MVVLFLGPWEGIQTSNKEGAFLRIQLRLCSMASFADVVTPEDAENMRQYIISRANMDRAEAQELGAAAGG